MQQGSTGSTTSNPPQHTRAKVAAKISGFSLFIVIAIILLALFLTSWRTINPGNIGIVFDKATHQISTEPLSPGWAFINPFTQSIQEYPMTIQTYSMLYKQSDGTSGDDSIKIQSKEGQEVNLDVVIQYRIKQEETAELYRDWGGASVDLVEERVVRQYTRSLVPAITAQYNWEEITSSKRAEITSQIEDELKEEFSLRHLELISFGIREVHLPGSLQKALTNKIQAQQEAERQKYQLDQARVKAQQTKVEAESEAEAVRIRARAEAESNEVIAKSLTPALIQYQQLKQWNGQLPIFQGSNVTPMIDTSPFMQQFLPQSNTQNGTSK